MFLCCFFLRDPPCVYFAPQEHGHGERSAGPVERRHPDGRRASGAYETGSGPTRCCRSRIRVKPPRPSPSSAQFPQYLLALALGVCGLEGGVLTSVGAWQCARIRVQHRASCCRRRAFHVWNAGAHELFDRVSAGLGREGVLLVDRRPVARPRPPICVSL